MTDPTPAELADLSLVGQKLWDLDDNRLENGTDYIINVGMGKKAYDTNDAAANKLFTMVSKHVWDKNTYRWLYHLRDNYSPATGQEETNTPEEKKEIGGFLDSIMETRPMLYVRKYLAQKGLAPSDHQEFKMMLVQMWFSFYRRETQNDSCGFEHVFLGESDNGQISGFHNWIQFWIEEAAGNVDYKGYIKPRNRSEVVDSSDRVISCQFAWKGQVKSITTMFIGTSPEFEVALLTLYFLAGSERNNIVIDGYELCVRCYAIRSQYGDKIGSAFVELMGEHDNHHN